MIICFFFFHFIYIIDSIDRFLYFKPTLHLWDQLDQLLLLLFLSFSPSSIFPFLFFPSLSLSFLFASIISFACKRNGSMAHIFLIYFKVIWLFNMLYTSRLLLYPIWIHNCGWNDKWTNIFKNGFFIFVLFLPCFICKCYLHYLQNSK